MGPLEYGIVSYESAAILKKSKVNIELRIKGVKLYVIIQEKFPRRKRYLGSSQKAARDVKGNRQHITRNRKIKI